MQGIYYISVHKRQTLLFNKKYLGRSRKDCPRFFVYGVGPYPEKFYFSLQIYHICHKPFAHRGLRSERCSDRFIFSRRAAEYSEEPQSVIYFDVKLTRVLRVYLIPKGRTKWR